MADQERESSSLNPMQASTGLNLESVITQVQPGQLTYALNAMVEGFDGQVVTYQNEQGNSLCITLPEGYKVIGVKNVTSINQVFYFLVNPSNGASMIGYSTLNSCVFIPLLDDTTPYSDQLGFNISYPIYKIEVKTTNCSTQLYWTDKFNPRRFLDLNNLPWKDNVIGQIDNDKLLVQPTFAVPSLQCTAVNIGGNLVEGDYQFAIQYADSLGEAYTSFYSVTNKVRIFLDNKVSPNFNEVTNKAISIQIDNLDNTGLYEYFNLAVVKTINNIASAELVGTYFINNTSYSLSYSGTEQSLSNIKLTMTDIFAKTDYYDLAGDLCQVDNVLIWADLVKSDDISYQKIWNKVNVGWKTWQIPYNHSEGYTNGANCANFQGYMRDEVYPLEGCFVLKNGKETTRAHIPGRVATALDLQIINNADVPSATAQDTCNPGSDSAPYWQVYNTGSITGTDPNYIPEDSCYKGPHMYGEMAYWESTELYPNNVAIWGDLANTPIRHHKFPDSTIIHIHDQNNTIGDAYGTYQHAIYPIGFNIDVQSLWDAIQNSTDLTQQEKDEIVGFKIMRGDRVNNKSIIAKGLLYNCGMYEKDGSSYYYPNYPYNDTNPDPFISSNPVGNQSGSNEKSRLDSFQLNRFTFHSPDTSFDRPSGIQGSFLKLETVEYGNAKCHFVPVKDNAREKLRTGNDLLVAATAGIISSLGLDINLTTGTTTDISTKPKFTPENFFPTFNNTLTILDKLMPEINYGWQYNSVGYYGNYSVVPDEGNKVRSIQYGGYINPGFQGTFGDDHAINNVDRESSVYICTTGNPFPIAGNDNSRVIASEVGLCGSSATFMRSIASYYGAIKQYLPGQWGQIFSYQVVDTGFYSLFLDSNDNLITNVPTIFGGDVFINRFALKRKMAFYNKTTVNHVDGTDIDYNQDADPITGLPYTATGNVGYPIWYYSTTNIPVDVNNGLLHAGLVNLINALNDWMLALATLGLTVILSAVQALIGLIYDLLTTLGIKITNLDCANFSGLHATGQAYLYAYGVPYYFAESEVNVDMRQATNYLEGNFYPQVSTDIPDDWMQQTNVPISFDNFYIYNNTYSKQNKETYFSILRPDWVPNNPCWIVFNNRAIWSDKSNLEETLNNWLIYKPANTFDFPKSFGKLTSIDALKNNQVLVRYEDRAQKYNALTTVQVSQGPAAYLGTSNMFSSPPVDLIHSDTGLAGSQHKLFINTDEGNVYIDAKRASVFMLGQQQSYFDGGIQWLSNAGMQKWFYQNLPFKIQNYFPNINIDNVFNSVGLTGSYDPYFGRVIITKKDYEPKNPNITYDGVNFWDGQLQVSLNDCNYFCDKSWTVSYSFKTKTWTSFHSYIPDYYITFYSHFQSGSNVLESTWDHDYSITMFNTFYGTIYPYILEYPHAYQVADEILQNVKDYTTVRKYIDYLTFYEPDVTIYFNKAVIYNGQQNTGLLNLVPRPLNNLSSYLQYPQFNLDSKNIIVTKSDNFYNYNTFWDIQISKSVPSWITTCSVDSIDKVLNSINLDYTIRSHKKAQIRAKDVKIRHILDNRNDVRLISKFVLAPTQISYK